MQVKIEKIEEGSKFEVRRSMLKKKSMQVKIEKIEEGSKFDVRSAFSDRGK